MWSRPENKLHAGKLLIIGGNLHGFASPAEAYEEAQKAGIGTARVILPNKLQKTVGKIFTAGEYAPSTPSGSFAVQALAELLDMAAWSDGVMLASNFGRNSETAILLEQFIEKYTGQLTLAGDSVDYFLSEPVRLLARPETTLILNLSQLQKLTASARFTKAFTSDMGLLKLVDTLQEFTSMHSANFIIQYENTVGSAAKNQVCTTENLKGDISEVKLGTHIATWWIQNPTKPLEASASAIYSLVS